MNTRSLLLLLAATSALAAPLLFTATTSAGDPDPRTDGGAGSETLDGGAEADAAPPPLPSYQVEPFSEERSAEPRATEWASAPQVAIDRSNPGLFAETTGPSFSHCEVRRVREWLRIHCAINTGAVSLLGGNRDGLAIRLDPTRHEEWTTFPEGAEIVLPVRRGDRRVIEWLGIEFGYKGMNSVEPAFVLSEQWASGDDRPIIVAR
jgi:hypothetical protein